MPQPIRTLITPPLILAGRNRTYKIGPDPAMKEQWASFMTDFDKIEGQVGFNAYGVCHSFGNGLMDYMCAVEVKDAGQVPGYMYTLAIPTRRTARSLKFTARRLTMAMTGLKFSFPLSENCRP